MNQIKIACLGECMIELSSMDLAAGAAHIGVAGDTLNTAVYLRRALPEQAEVHYITALNVDDLSDQMSARLTQWGIRTDHIRRVPEALPWLYNITLDALGERSFQYWRAGSAASRMMQDDGIVQEVLYGFDVVFLSGISLATLPPQDRARLINRL